MSETTETTPETTTKATKPKVEKIAVQMTDGRTVEFPLSRKVDKTPLIENGAFVGVRFDYVNGETRTVLLSELPTGVISQSACHGVSQKVGDSTAGAKDKEMTVEDIVLTHDEMIERLRKGEWNVERATGDSMAGASIIIKALVEVTGQEAAWVKAYLENMLEEGKAGGLTRQRMYASFRDPASEIGRVIRRLEEEKAAANAAFNADDLTAKMRAAAAAA